MNIVTDDGDAYFCRDNVKAPGQSGRGLLEVYQGWTDAASAGDLEEVY